MRLKNGYELDTTRWVDFKVAEVVGLDTIDVVWAQKFEECKSDYKLLTELTIAIGVRYRESDKMERHTIAQKYYDLYYKTRAYALENLSGDEFKYYYDWTV